MRIRTLVLGGIAALLLVALVATPILLAPGAPPAARPLPGPLAADEQAALIEALRPPKRERPLIAIATFNAGTEVSDFLSAYGVLSRSGVADVTVLAEKAERVRLYPGLSVDPQATFAQFDALHPEGADYVVVPAMDPGTDRVVAEWLVAQRSKGATIVGICNGARMLATAGLLDGRRATSHWSTVAELRRKHPTMQWVPDRRYVVDNGVATSTGVTANIPITLALVEAIAGRDAAERTATGLGVDHWDARHDSAAFELTTEHKKTFIRNALTFWRRDTVGVPLADGVDEVGLGLLVDAWLRTNLATLTSTSAGGQPVTTAHGLVIYPDAAAETARLDLTLAPPPADRPAGLLETTLPAIVARYDRPTAGIVALTMEYPWTANAL